MLRGGPLSKEHPMPSGSPCLGQNCLGTLQNQSCPSSHIAWCQPSAGTATCGHHGSLVCESHRTETWDQLDGNLLPASPRACHCPKHPRSHPGQRPPVHHPASQSPWKRQVKVTSRCQSKRPCFYYTSIQPERDRKQISQRLNRN